MQRATTRELARSAVQQEIAEVAERLFLARGYEHTTVEEIAAKVGISSRTFFRYFATKDEPLFLRLDRTLEEFLAEVARRPADEAPWETLRVAFLALVERGHESGEHDWAARMQRITAEAPALIGIQLKRIDTVEQQITEQLLARITPAGTEPQLADRVRYRALVGAAGAGLSAAMRQSEDCGMTLAERLGLVDLVFVSLRPADRELGGEAEPRSLP